MTGFTEVNEVGKINMSTLSFPLVSLPRLHPQLASWLAYVLLSVLTRRAIEVSMGVAIVFAEILGDCIVAMGMTACVLSLSSRLLSSLDTD